MPLLSLLYGWSISHHIAQYKGLYMVQLQTALCPSKLHFSSCTILGSQIDITPVETT